MKHFCTFLLLLILSNRLTAVVPVSAGKVRDWQPYGYWENKGQIVDQDGNRRSDILYYFEQNGFTLALGRDFFSYQITTRINDPDTSELPESREEQRESDDLSAREPYLVKMERADVKLLGARNNVKISAYGTSAETRNYYTPAGAFTGIHHFQKIVYENIYPNIDLAFYIEPAAVSENAKLKYDFIIRTGGDVSAIQLSYSGPALPAINADGELMSHFPQTGFVKESKPLSYFEAETDSFFIPWQSDGSVISFKTKKAKNKKVLTIDPEINWGRYIGGIQDEFIEMVEADGSGNIYCSGQTWSNSGVITSGAYQTTKNGVSDCFIARLSSSGAMDWCTYFGGESVDFAMGMYLDGFGNFYLCGQTKSLTVMATPGSYQETHGGVNDGFISKFLTSGILVWSTYFGGPEKEQAFACVSDQAGVYVIGYTESAQNVATNGADQEIYGDGGDAFIAGFSPAGSILFATYLGGAGQDRGHDLVLDKFGNLMVVGTTPSETGIALGNVYQTELGGNNDIFIGKYSKTGKKKWCTYYGGLKTERGREIITDAAGNSYVTGSTASGLFMVTTGAYQTLLNGIGPSSQLFEDAYLVKLDSSGNQVWGTYFGGGNDEIGSSIKWLPNGLIFIAGTTNSDNLISTPDGLQTSRAGDLDAFIAIFTEEGQLIWSSYFGGSEDEIYDDGYGPAFDIYEQRQLFLGVSTASAGLATINKYTPANSGPATTDALLVDFDLGCLDRYEPNNKLANAYALPAIDEPVSIDALINYAGDKDFYSFTKTGEWPLNIYLSKLAQNYDLVLFDSLLNPVKKSHHAGLGDEEITINPSASGKFYVAVVNPGVAYSGTCYNLTIQNMDGMVKLPTDEIAEIGFEIHPNPANDECTVFISSLTEQQDCIRISDITGKMMHEQCVTLTEGENEVPLNISKLHSGTYLVTLVNSGVSVRKLVVY